MRSSCRLASFVEITDRRARAQPFQSLLRPGHIKPPRPHPWRVEHPAVEQVLHQGDVVQRELADEQHVEAAAFGECFEDPRDPAQVDRILHRAATHDDPDGDGLTITSGSALPDGITFDAGVFSGTLSFDSDGVYPITVTVRDGKGGAVTASFTWTVTDIVQGMTVFASGFE